MLRRRKKKKKEEGELERSELGRSDRLQKRKVVKREKWKGMCVEEKKQREKKRKKRNSLRVWRIKKEGRKKEKKKERKWYHNIFTINFKW